MTIPNPGSDEAIEQGCSCPVLDNNHGEEALGDTRGFWITPGCPLHDIQTRKDKKEGNS